MRLNLKTTHRLKRVLYVESHDFSKQRKTAKGKTFARASIIVLLEYCCRKCLKKQKKRI